jgi:hypothetical protein
MPSSSRLPSRRDLVAVALTAGSLLLTELALTRIFSVVMFYHFAFLAISIALFGLSASGVYVYLRRKSLDEREIGRLLARQSLIFAAGTIGALAVLVRVRAQVTPTAGDVALMVLIYLVAAVPFFTGGLVLTLAISRFSPRINAVYAADLLGAAAACVILIPLMNAIGAPGVIFTAAALAIAAAVLYAPAALKTRLARTVGALLALSLTLHLTGLFTFGVGEAKGFGGRNLLFSKWNSFSRVGVYKLPHGDWSVSSTYKGDRADSLYMDIDSAASTPIPKISPDFANAQHLKFELTALAYRMKEGTPFSALVIGPGGGRDLASALVFGAGRVDAVEINPIIANDVMRGQFHEWSGGLYTHPRVTVTVDDGRSFVRRTDRTFDVIQASLVDTWAAQAAGAYTLTENTLYTVEAFQDYVDHLAPDGIVTFTRWVTDGLRLVSLARAVCEARGWDPSRHVAVVQHDKLATFLFKRQPFSAAETEMIRRASAELDFTVLWAPGPTAGDPANDYARLVTAQPAAAFYDAHPDDVRPTTDNRPFYFLTTKLGDQFRTAIGRDTITGSGVGSLLTLMAIAGVLVLAFVLGPLAVSGGALAPGWPAWLLYFSGLGAGFMLFEVAILQRFVLLLGHPVYSLTVTLFSLLLGTGLGAALSRRLSDSRLRVLTTVALVAIAAAAWLSTIAVPSLIEWAIPFGRPVRILVAVAVTAPLGLIMGIPMPAGIRLLSARADAMVPWAWGMNGALSVVGATLALFIAMNWGFGATFMAAGVVYIIAAMALVVAARPRTAQGAM